MDSENKPARPRGDSVREPSRVAVEGGRASAERLTTVDERGIGAPMAGERAALEEVALPHRLGRYLLLRRIGRGGMGVVFEAQHVNLKRNVALKVMRHSGRSSAMARFAQEMEAVGRVEDAHVVRATDAGEEAGVLFLAMELLEGQNLDEILRGFGPLNVPDVCALGRQACLGLDAVARKHLVHRDIKPSNLMLTSKGELKILDLGLARLRDPEEFAGELTPSECLMGTFDYQSPEQAGSPRDVDVRSDLYSLGCALYKLLAGHAPYASEPTFVRKIEAHRDKPFPPWPAACPEALRETLGRFVAKSPADRFATAKEAADALTPFCEGADLPRVLQTARRAESGGGDVSGALAQTPSLRHDETATRTAVPSRRRWRFAALVAAPFVVAGLYFVLASWLKEGDSPNGRVLPLTDGTRNESEEEPPPKKLKRPPWVAGEWINVLDQAPTKLRWPDYSRDSRYQFDDKKQELWITTAGASLMAFGETQAPSYLVQVGISQPDWSGGLGVFFGYREIDASAKTARCQFIDLTNTGLRDFKKALRIQRVLSTIRQDERGNDVSDNKVVGTAFLPLPPNNEEILEIHVQSKNLKAVRWGGQFIQELASPAAAKAVPAEDCVGSFGSYTFLGAGVYRNARFMYFGKE